MADEVPVSEEMRALLSLEELGLLRREWDPETRCFRVYPTAKLSQLCPDERTFQQWRLN